MSRQQYYVALAVLVVSGALGGCAKPTDPLVRVSALAQKNMAEVNSILGRPVAIDEPQPSGAVDATYQVEGFTLFIVTYSGTGGLTSTIAGELKTPVSNADEAFALFGLAGAKPDHHSRAGERAHGVGGWREVGVLGSPYDYVYATNR